METNLFDLVTTAKRERPVLCVLYGQSGIGKSTWATKAPKPIFIPAERGLDQIAVHKFPTPTTFAEFYRMVDAVDREKHEFQSLVIDTIDAVELLVWQRVLAEGSSDKVKLSSIEEFGGGYGKGYVRAREIWTGLLSKLAQISERLNVILLAHAHIKSVNDPSLPSPYDIWRIRLHDKSAEIVRQMVDLILFVTLEASISKDNPKARKGKALLSGDRLMYTSPGNGYEAKNRFSLPNPMPFEWDALQTEITKFYQQ